jgi:hypothetical protein
VVSVKRYRRTRFWAVYEAGVLLCVTVYKKGATAVKARLEDLESGEPSQTFARDRASRTESDTHRPLEDPLAAQAERMPDTTPPGSNQIGVKGNG